VTPGTLGRAATRGAAGGGRTVRPAAAGGAGPADAAPETSPRWPLALRLALLAAVLVVALLAAVRLGAVSLGTGAVLDAVAGRGDPTVVTIVRELRLPRAAQAALVGAALAVSGATFQALLRNPLAEPYVLGVSSGAAAGAVATVVTGWAARTVWALPAAAFAGAALSMLLVLRIALSVGRALDTRVLLLAGVVVSSFLTALIWLVLTFADIESVRSAVFWMMGSHAGASWRSVGTLAACLVPSLVVLQALARPLNLLAIGEPTAAYLGTSVERTKLLAFATATLLTATAVAVSGTIGFVGLVVPHAVRLVWGGDNRALLPCAALLGAAFLVGADTLARTLAGATELPVGVVTALVGVPCFVWLLRRPPAP
jgi:iron complex transport system permease protein